jgi:hypothetical protein
MYNICILVFFLKKAWKLESAWHFLFLDVLLDYIVMGAELLIEPFPLKKNPSSSLLHFK